MFSNMRHRFQLKSLIRGLVKLGMEPRNVDITSVGNGHFSSVYDVDEDSPISSQVYGSFDANPTVAAIKGIVEYVERTAFREGKQAGLRSCLTERSDGFAGFPTVGLSFRSAGQAARRNALHEACERFVWPTWWDNSNVGQAVVTVDDELLYSPLASSLLSEVSKLICVKRFLCVEPFIENSHRPGSLIILIAELVNGGVATGGAFGPPRCAGRSIRAASELYRHSLALARLSRHDASPNGFYQERLAYFATKEGGLLLEARLSKGGSDKISYPRLAVDEEIPHRAIKLVTVHRCLFEGQPPFVGGNLERLCI